MSNIINFPNAVQKGMGDIGLKPVTQAVRDSGNLLIVGPWHYTCHRCQTKTSFESQNMVFRSIEFFCSTCGTPHRVTNPAFSAPKK